MRVVHAVRAVNDHRASEAREFSQAQCFRGAMPLAPAFLVAALNPLLGFGDGAFVDMLLTAVHEPHSTEPARWDAALVSYVGYWSHYDQRMCVSSWPLPATADADELVQFAAVSGATSCRPVRSGSRARRSRGTVGRMSRALAGRCCVRSGC
jgi:hypothetical protein